MGLHVCQEMFRKGSQRFLGKELSINYLIRLPSKAALFIV
jgi:hypothetical protein